MKSRPDAQQNKQIQSFVILSLLDYNGRPFTMRTLTLMVVGLIFIAVIVAPDASCHRRGGEAGGKGDHPWKTNTSATTIGGQAINTTAIGPVMATITPRSTTFRTTMAILIVSSNPIDVKNGK
ncbi:uncharacterized protein LOC110679650 [Aedes aegypti]|uniref:Uncharacterized protein n=1 Tax=Aedes aegypti TaxID=7159 RepID=A0A6I8U1A3_AEDAE|nr:uncharacterized protein LOC110679650 [Aedes aegypti]